MGDNKKISSGDNFILKRRSKKRRNRIIAGLSCLVITATVGALVLPAMTLNKKDCELEEHQHSADCYVETRVLSCNTESLGLHRHAQECYDAENNLVCQYADYLIHEHDANCYDENGALVCALPEIKEHRHDDSCYVWTQVDSTSEETVRELICTETEVIAHTHNELCLDEYGYLQCGAVEVNKHVHDDNCFITEQVLTCELPEHVHDENCFSNDEEAKTDEEAVEVEEETAEETEEVQFSVEDVIKLIDELPFIEDTEEKLSQLEEDSDEMAEFISELTPAVQTAADAFDTLTEEEQEAVTNVEKLEYYRQLVLGEEISETGEIIEKTAIIYADDTYQTVLEEDETEIILTGIIPEDAEVRAYPVERTLDDDKRVICAYDITIFLADGTHFQPEDDETITVAIRTSKLDGETEETPIEVYHIPSHGDPVMMEDVEIKDGEATFVTNHFSEYALASSNKLSAVYIDGVNGNDSASGTSGAPVKTFEQAAKLLAEGGTIYIQNTVSITEATTWSLDDSTAMVKRASGFTGPMVTVKGNGSLTLSNVTLDGGNGGNLATIIDEEGAEEATTYSYSNEYASNSVKAPLVVVESGGQLSVTDGAVLQNNSNKPDITPGATSFYKNGYVGLGGAIYCEGTMDMTGGTIQNCEAQSGGGVYIENGKFYLSGGTIDNNRARNIQACAPIGYANSHRTNAGGGVYVGDNSEMQMSGGTISNNQSTREGGGIALGWFNRDYGSNIDSYITHFTMTGGTITNNKALSTGGGINVAAGREATISQGDITKNRANGMDTQLASSSDFGNTVFSGGGIYVDAEQRNSNKQYAGVRGKLTLYRVVINNNTTYWYGGGIASCGTAKSYLYPEQAKNFGTAIYNNTVLAGSNRGNEFAINNTDPSNFTIGDYILGGGLYNWDRGSNTGQLKGLSNNGKYSIFDNHLTDSSPEIIDANELATVYISGNYGTLGGGIACNGLIYGGGENTTTSIRITKNWVGGEGIHPEYVTAKVYKITTKYGNSTRDLLTEVRIYKNKIVDQNGKEDWPTYILDGLPTIDGVETYTYEVEEVPVPGYDVSYDHTGNDANGYEWNITNTFTGFQVVKQWENDGDSDRPESITVQLYQNGTAYGDPVTLNAEGEWKYLWENLPKADSQGNVYTYTAQETKVPDGYDNISSELDEQSGQWIITNKKYETTSVSVEKKWGNNSTQMDSVTIQLLADGEPYGDPVVLNNDNNWFKLWDNLRKYNDADEEIAYTVEEEYIIGYTVDIQMTKPNKNEKAWTTVETLEEGQTYLLVSTSGAMSTGSANGLVWQDVSTLLNTGDEATSNMLWTYTGGKFVNGNGRYLTLNTSSGYSGTTRYYSMGTSGSTITFADGHLSALDYYNYRYYLSGISNGSGTASYYENNAVSFTPYALKVVPDDRGDTHYIVTNTEQEEQYVLPKTGGSGTMVIYFVGAILIVLSVVLLVTRRRMNIL